MSTPEEDTKQLNVRVPRATLRLVKMQAKGEGKTLATYIDELIVKDALERQDVVLDSIQNDIDSLDETRKRLEAEKTQFLGLVASHNPTDTIDS